MKNVLLKCCLLPISAFFSAYVSYAQLPTRDNFSFLFENNYDDNTLGKYLSTDFATDWNKAAGSSPYGNVEIINDDATHKKAMRVYYPEGTFGTTPTHGNTWYSYFSTKGDEIYFSYDIRFKPGFEWVHGGKIPGVVGGSVTTGQLPTSTSGFSSRMMWKGGGSLVFYIYHHDQTGIYGDSYEFENFQFQTGKWYNITMRVVLNTVNNGVASRNGILEGYIDGKLIFQKTDFRFRLQQTVKIEKMYICSFFGGGTQEWAASRDEWMDTDNYVAYVYSSKPTNVPRGLQANTTKTLLHPYYNFTGTVVNTTLPAAPSVLAYSSYNSTSATLNWNDNSSNESGFRVERKTGTGIFTQVAQLGANIKSYTNTGLTPSTSYTYRVCSYNSDGISAYSNSCIVQTPSNVSATNLAPGKPSSQSATAFGGIASRANDNNTNGTWSAGSVSNTGNTLRPYWQVDLQSSYSLTNIEVWNRTDACCISSLTGFYVFVSDNPFTSADPIITKNQSGVWNSYYTGFPNPSTAFTVNRSGRYVRIQLANQGELSIAEVKVFGTAGLPTQTVLNAPANLSSVAVTSQSVQLNWSDNASNESGFRVERKTGTGSFLQVGQLSANTGSFTDTGLTGSTSYTYRVYAYNSTGNSAYSNLSTIQTPADPVMINNIAPGKPSSQSGTAYSAIASRANDNNTSGIWSEGSVSNTGSQLNPYWQVDLQGIYPLTKIEVWNRTDACCVNRLVNYYVFVSDNPFTSADPIATRNQSGVWSSFNANYPNPSTSFTVSRTGRYVRVQLAGQGELSIAEVKVFGNTLKSAGIETSLFTEPEETLSMKIFPNPSYGKVNIHFSLTEEEKGYLGVYDMSGRLINMLAEGNFARGINEFSWEQNSSGGITALLGIYLIKLVAGNHVAIQKVMISR